MRRFTKPSTRAAIGSSWSSPLSARRASPHRPCEEPGPDLTDPARFRRKDRALSQSELERNDRPVVQHDVEDVSSVRLKERVLRVDVVNPQLIVRRPTERGVWRGRIWYFIHSLCHRAIDDLNDSEVGHNTRRADGVSARVTHTELSRHGGIAFRNAGSVNVDRLQDLMPSFSETRACRIENRDRESLGRAGILAA